jgi:hypothetical protein
MQRQCRVSVSFFSFCVDVDVFVLVVDGGRLYQYKGGKAPRFRIGSYPFCFCGDLEVYFSMLLQEKPMI